MRMRLAAAVAAAGLAAGGCSLFSEDPPPAPPAQAGSFSQADLDQAVTAATSQAREEQQARTTAALQRLETDLERAHERELTDLAAAFEAGIAERERIATEKAEQLGVLAAQHEAELADAAAAHQQERMQLEDARAEAAELADSYAWFVEFVGTTADCTREDETVPPSSACYAWEQPVRDLIQDPDRDWMYPHEAQELVDDIIEAEAEYAESKSAESESETDESETVIVTVETVTGEAETGETETDESVWAEGVWVQFGGDEYIEFICGLAVGGCATSADDTIHILGKPGEPEEAAADETHLQGSRRTVLHELGHQIFYRLPTQPGLFGMFDDKGEPRRDDDLEVHGHATLLFRCVVADLYVKWLEWDIPHKDAVQRVCAQTGFVFTSERPDPEAETDTVEDENEAAVAG